MIVGRLNSPERDKSLLRTDCDAESAMQGVSAVKLNVPSSKVTEAKPKAEPTQAKAGPIVKGVPGLSVCLSACLPCANCMHSTLEVD